MKINLKILVVMIFLGVGCSTSAKNMKAGEEILYIKTLKCEDEYSLKNQIADNGLSLEIKQSSNDRYDAVITKLGFVGEILREISVIKSEKGNKIFYRGENFLFSLKGSIGQLEVLLESPASYASQNKPTQQLKEKMVCRI